MTGVAVSEGTHHAPHAATAAALTVLWPMDAPITTHTKHWDNSPHKMQIDTGDSDPVSQRPYPFATKHHN